MTVWRSHTKKVGLLSSRGQVVHTTEKQVISFQGKNANCYQMYRKLEKPRAKRAKILFFIVTYANLCVKYADFLMLPMEILEGNNRAPLYYSSLKLAFTVVCVYWYPSTFTTGTMIHSNVSTKCVTTLSWL